MPQAISVAVPMSMREKIQKTFLMLWIILGIVSSSIPDESIAWQMFGASCFCWIGFIQADRMQDCGDRIYSLVMTPPVLACVTFVWILARA